MVKRFKLLLKKPEKTPQEHVDEMAKMAKDLWKKMDIKYDYFIRTTEERHVKKQYKKYLNIFF